MSKNLKIFENGAKCVRADFHLHTKADAEFVYNDDIDFFAKNYLDKLEEQDIRIGAITNHNKFDEIEFKELRKNGLKRDIYLLAGVEFSVKDGSKGLHVLIIFHDDWFINSESTNYIQQFINGAFSGVANYDRPPYDVNSNYDFQGLCSKLDIFKRDYFIILAHVDDSSGLFVELDGRGLHTFINNECFTKNVLGLQKVRSQNNIHKIRSILTDRVPAFVEGTDCAHKGIDGLGLGHEINGIPQKVYLERVGELRKVESRANFVSTKMQRHDQTVFETDRLSMGRNFAFFQS